MINLIKKIFNKNIIEDEPEEFLETEDFFKEEVKESSSCKNCIINYRCKDRDNLSDECKYVTDKVFDEDKPSIVLIDDNPGIISFLQDDLQYLNDKKLINLNNYNIIAYDGVNAGFNLAADLVKLKTLNIKYAIIDITIGGSIMTEKGNIKYNGIDIFEIINKTEEDFKFLFYTGNNLNTHIKYNKMMIDKFYKITGKDIYNFVLFKTTLDINKRREYIYNYFFK